MTIPEHSTALVTGASAGIGAIYADRLAHRGYDLIVVARDTARLEALATRLRAETGRQVAVLTADLTDPADLARVTSAVAEAPNLGLVVNNAGMALAGTLTTTPEAHVARLIALNVTAPTLFARAAAIRFSAAGRGTIINVSSVLALAPELFDATYSATKSFVLTLSQGLANELAGHGVHVQAVLPGATRTEIWERSGVDIGAFPPEWVMDATDLVDAALVGLDRGETVTIPPLADKAGWTDLQAARLTLAPLLSRRDVAPRYLTAQAA